MTGVYISVPRLYVEQSRPLWANYMFVDVLNGKKYMSPTESTFVHIVKHNGKYIITVFY